jgi:hypothetical protein
MRARLQVFRARARVLLPKTSALAHLLGFFPTPSYGEFSAELIDSVE